MAAGSGRYPHERTTPTVKSACDAGNGAVLLARFHIAQQCLRLLTILILEVNTTLLTATMYQ
jgi:hypothetical protein